MQTLVTLEPGKTYIVRRKWESRCSFRVDSITGDELVGTFLGTINGPVQARFGLRDFLGKYEISEVGKLN